MTSIESLYAIDTDELAAEIQRLPGNEVSKSVTDAALSQFRELFASGDAVGARMVVQHLAGIENAEFIAALSVALVQDLLKAAESASP